MGPCLGADLGLGLLRLGRLDERGDNDELNEILRLGLDTNAVWEDVFVMNPQRAAEGGGAQVEKEFLTYKPLAQHTGTTRARTEDAD